MAPPIDGAHNGASHQAWLHQHGIGLTIAQQIGAHKAWTDVGKANGQMAHVGLLLQGLHINILKSLGSTVCRGGSQTLGARNGGYDGYMAASTFGKVAIGLTHHSREPHPIGEERAHLLGGIEGSVLPSHTSGVE